MFKRLLTLIIFGIAFGFVEAAVVIYLRTMLGQDPTYINGPYKVLLNLGAIAFVLPENPIFSKVQINSIEMLREFATLIMLTSISILAATKNKQRLGAFLVSFAIWDLFYYLFLRLCINWPTSFLDIDLYFLIPIPWIGPVITPVIISLILFIIGTRMFLKD
ncbi:MAG: hypothetical protein M1607_03255 [Patescibacteria group bacterium]|nr:hypothetical protein [Patescibacteria group bacterium]